jgi:hypothetical protein
MFSWRDILERAMWTAIEVILPTIPTGALVFSASAWKVALSTVIITAVAFGVAVLKNLLKQHREIAKLGEPVAALAEEAVAVRVAETA